MKEENQFKIDAERIYHQWDAALSGGDADGLLGLYALDATIESPVICHLLKRERGICKGHAEIRELIEAVMARKPPIRKYYRKQLFTDGQTMMWEYPRKTPDGEQMDFVEVMEISQGLIHHHRVYWGWKGIQVLQHDTYHQ